MVSNGDWERRRFLSRRKFTYPGATGLVFTCPILAGERGAGGPISRVGLLWFPEAWILAAARLRSILGNVRPLVLAGRLRFIYETSLERLSKGETSSGQTG